MCVHVLTPSTWFSPRLPRPLCSLYISFQAITAPAESTGMGDLLQKLLTLDPKRRATATEALCHNFFDEGL